MKKDSCAAVRRSNCSVSRALDAIGDKWSLIILRDLMFTDKRSYTELQSSDEGIATNILAARLSSLEANGIILKTPDPDNGRRSWYTLTEKGIGLLPVIMELTHWMSRHDPDAIACSKHMKSYERNRIALLTEHTQRLRQEHLKG